VGPKRRIHDARTPEGVYLTAAPSRRSRFHLFLPIDYPSLADAEAGLAAGIISRRTRDAIARAHAEFRMPPQTTRLGGWLGFHGEGPRWQGDSQHLDWTYGCVAMSDAQIEFLAERAPVGTRVEIQP
jgi:murein L,D-transpeptidase YafK